MERYLEIAKENKVNAVITVSNQFTARPEHHPLQLSKKLTRRVELFHWPWMWVLTQASLLQIDRTIDDPDRTLILDELVRFLSHDSVGIDGFDRMNKEWKDVVQAVRNGATLRKNSQEVERTVASWHEEERDLCLILSRHLGRPVRLKLERKYRDCPIERLKADCERLTEAKLLECTLSVPDAAAELNVCADLNARTVRCAMRLEAPKDRKSTKARVNWLLRQISKAEDPDIHVRAMWPSRVPDSMEPLARVRENPEVLQTENPKLTPHTFELLLIRDLAGRFSGTQTFIERVEEAVPRFYDQIGQHLRAWHPAPPKPRPQSEAAEGFEASENERAAADL